MFNALDISTSGLVANRVRMNTVAANMANQDAFLDENGNNVPFRRRIAMLAPGDPTSGSALGVHVAEIAEDQADFRRKHEPDSPFANEDGYVLYPNISPVIEQMNMMEASRSYESNIAVIEATKSMISVALQIIA